ncbi:hypothetical protein [Tunturiibacter gelidoferens]|jgi:hypothetical protein|uniref:Uncharacterized protein n=1 Tax=Tunturiibacter gelidiferens TaxID=3069689 RepID=A0A9X0QB07_9BACT|nr:hypothetical protein [Edaphobacter lichenicola]MBB5327072.1 hypothetical protein [Edaphobacter lichenicola]
MSFNFTYSVCLALACLSAGSTTKAQESNKPQYGSWGIDLTAMDPNVKPGNDSISTPQARGLPERKSRLTSPWLRCAT